MNSFKESFRNWFGYSRRERRSTFILLNIIVVIFGLRYIYPSGDNSLKIIPIELLNYNTDSSLMIRDTPVLSRQQASKNPIRKRPIMNLNICDSASLVALPGIGPVLSSRIIKYRNLIGGYVSVDQLKEVYGLPEETFDMISAWVIADSLTIRKIMINDWDFRQLIRHPYFQRSEVSAILKYRELNGRISGIGDMIENNLVSAETAIKIRPYLEFGE
jgi:DNA uptake protein ComE-like DNA-binding protein